jgi:hypothetical protein
MLLLSFSLRKRQPFSYFVQISRSTLRVLIGPHLTAWFRPNQAKICPVSIAMSPSSLLRSLANFYLYFQPKIMYNTPLLPAVGGPVACPFPWGGGGYSGAKREITQPNPIYARIEHRASRIENRPNPPSRQLKRATNHESRVTSHEPRVTSHACPPLARRRRVLLAGATSQCLLLL